MDPSGLKQLAGELTGFVERLENELRKALEEWGQRDLLESWYRKWPRPEWAPLAPATIERKRRGGYPLTPLIRTGDLIMAATTRYSRGNIFDTTPTAGSIGSLVVGVDDSEIEYAEMQHDGSDTKNIPARPWDNIGDDDMMLLSDRIDAAAQKVFSALQ